MGFGVFFFGVPVFPHRVINFQSVTAAFTVSSSVPVNFASQREGGPRSRYAGLRGF
jgi:hypothetical protein